MKVLITGAGGFIGTNLKFRLAEENIRVIEFVRGDSKTMLENGLVDCDFVIHLAGVNRPKNPEQFSQDNVNFTQLICDIIADKSLNIPVIYASSIQADSDNDYGSSKRRCEHLLDALRGGQGCKIYTFRLPNVFGKWCKPNYNSVVATFCHNVANDIPITINDPKTKLTLVYIDDVVDDFLYLIKNSDQEHDGLRDIKITYEATLSEIAEKVYSFKAFRKSGVIENVGVGFIRALYSTYLSYVQPSSFDYGLGGHVDARGVFVEMLKTKGAGQISFFSAYPGVTRGGHYHHSKNEKFMVIRGRARFTFRHIVSNEYHSLDVDGKELKLVDTVPGWTHDITNIGSDELYVMLWANEIFDPQRPDTIALEV